MQWEIALFCNEMVGVRGLEPPTSASQALRAPKLRYTPIQSGNEYTY